MTNEIKVMKEFIIEFCPFYTIEMLENFRYSELVSLVKQIVEDM